MQRVFLQLFRNPVDGPFKHKASEARFYPCRISFPTELSRGETLVSTLAKSTTTVDFRLCCDILFRNNNWIYHYYHILVHQSIKMKKTHFFVLFSNKKQWTEKEKERESDV